MSSFTASQIESLRGENTTHVDLPQLSKAMAEEPCRAIHEGVPIDSAELLQSVERLMMIEALEKTDGVVAHAAHSIGIKRTTFIEKMRRYALTVDKDDSRRTRIEKEKCRLGTVLREARKHCNNRRDTVTHAAQSLGISPRTLQDKIYKLQIAF